MPDMSLALMAAHLYIKSGGIGGHNEHRTIIRIQEGILRERTRMWPTRPRHKENRVVLSLVNGAGQGFKKRGPSGACEHEQLLDEHLFWTLMQ